MRSALLYVGLTVGALVLILFFGIPILGKFAAFLHDLGSSNKPVDANDTTPPAPPQFESLPEVTNESSIDLNGRTEPGATVILKLNDEEKEVLSNADGKFTFSWSLWDGDNKISGKSKDAGGNESQSTPPKTVVVDKKDPDLDITNPANGSKFTGTANKQISVKGTTEESVSVTINDRIVAVDSTGHFNFSTALGEGNNEIKIKATDRAGNTTEKSIAVTYTP